MIDRLGRGASSSVRRTARALAVACLPHSLMMASRSATSPPTPTFDDGPDPALTPRLLDLLGQHGVRAWFFLVGERAVQHPEVVRRIVGEGHQIGNHSWSHPGPRTMTDRAYLRDVERAQGELEAIVGHGVRDFRPPHGFLTPGTTLRLWQRRQRIVLWNVDPKDYATGTSVEIADNLKRLSPRQGDLVLLHDTHLPTVTALEAGAMDVFAARGAA